MAFYDIFEQLCKECGISPTRVALDNGIKQQSVSSWKIRGSTPKAETVQKLANYFGVSVDYLLDTKPNPIKKELNGTKIELVLSTDEQDYIGFNAFLESIGYKILFDLGSFDNVNHEQGFVLLDKRSEKKYFVPNATLYKLISNITAFTKYQVDGMISILTEIPKYQREEK